MIKWRYDSSGWRPDPATLGKVIDIGGANSFAHGHLDAIIDIRQPQAAAKNIFIGDISQPDVWLQVSLKRNHLTQLEDGAVMAKIEKWDYAICTHTLEDIVNPVFAARNIQLIANAGLIVVPSKFREFGRFQGPFRGYMHHHWIFDVLDGKLTAWPKLNIIEDKRFDRMPGPETGGEELIIEWEGSIDLEMINQGMPYGTDKLSGEQHMWQLYEKLLP